MHVIFIGSRVFRQAAVFAGAVDACELLVDDSPGPDVQVPDFRIAHLPLRQPHGLARSLYLDMRAGGGKFVERWRVG